MNKARHIARSLALLVALCLVLAWFPARAMAEETEEDIPTSGTCGDSGSDVFYTFDKTTGTLTIDGTGAIRDYSNYKDAPWADVRSEITNIVVKEGVTGIFSCAFDYLDNLTSITIPASVSLIGAFMHCPSLTGIWVDENNPYYSSDDRGVLFNKEKTILEKAPGGIQGDYSIPETVTYIAGNSFEDCSSLTDVEIPDGVTTIWHYAFSGCSSLTSVTIPASVESLANSQYPVFNNCENLTGIWVDSDNPNYYSDENGVLLSKDKRILLTVPSGIQGSYTIPDTVEQVMYYAFSSCGGLTDIVIPDSVTFIGDYAFLGCSSLTSITIPQNAEYVGGGVFDDCTNLENIIILSTSCELGNIATGDPNMINKDIIICGYPGSSAEKYVNDRNSFFDSGIAFNIYNWEFVSLKKHEVIAGAKGEWTADSGEALTFRADGELDKFISVSVDDTTVDPSNYTVKSGSTIITFTEDYLKTLSVGEHTLTVTFADGLAQTAFTVKAAPEGPSTDPETPTQPAEQPSEPAAEPDEQPAEQPSEPAAEPDEQPAEQPGEPAAEPEETSAGTDETAAPTEPAIPSDNPKTGDNTVVLCLALLLVSGLGIMAIAAYRHKFF